MKNSVVLFKNSNTELPNKFLNSLIETCSDLVELTVKNKIDFKRWNQEYRTDYRFIKSINDYDKTHPGFKKQYFNIIKVSNYHSFVIYFDETTKEEGVEII